MKKTIVGMDLTKWVATPEELDSALARLAEMQKDLDETLEAINNRLTETK